VKWQVIQGVTTKLGRLAESVNAITATGIPALACVINEVSDLTAAAVHARDVVLPLMDRIASSGFSFTSLALNPGALEPSAIADCG
jgi:hypothetical protein